MRAAASLPVVSCLLLVGCGYVGPVLPPSPMVPNTITNLTASQRGGDILVAFGTPPRTTDSIAIKNFADIDLRVGPPGPPPFDYDRWAAAAKAYSVPVPPLGDPHDPEAVSISTVIPASDWQGQRVVVAVRTAVKKGDNHYSAWSNRLTLNVVAALTPPVAAAKATAQGVLLTWQAVSSAQYRVYRQGAADPSPVEQGTVGEGKFVDTSAQFDVPYKYTLVAIQESAESLPSEAVSITPSDTFAPSVPAGVTALVGPGSVEISWQRSPEADVAGYYVYRSVNGSPFERQGKLINLSIYSDHAVEAGKTYRYQISSVDRKNNESDKSAIAEAAF